MSVPSRATTRRRRRGVVPVPLIALTVIGVAAAGVGLWWVLDNSEAPRADAETVSFESALEAYRAGEYADSESALEQIVAEDGDDLDARKTLAEVYAAQGKNAEAIEQYAAVVEADAGDHESLYRMALLERLIGDSLASITHLEAAVDAERRGTYLNDLAMTYVQVGRYAEAIEAWHEVLDEGGLDEAGRAGVYSAIATAYEGMRDYEGARSALENARALMPNDPDLQARLESMGTQ